MKAKGAALKATEQPIDTSTAAGKAFLDMLGVVCGVRNLNPQGAPARRHRQGQARRRLQGPHALRGRGAGSCAEG